MPNVFYKRFAHLNIFVLISFILLVGLSFKYSFETYITLKPYKRLMVDSRFLQSYRNDENSKRILIWSESPDQTLEDYCLVQRNVSKMDFCEFKCEYTLNKAKLNASDAVVIYGAAPDSMHPSFRVSPLQRWIFYLFESPQNSHRQVNRPGSVRPHVFNWTLSYRHDADISVQYGQIIPETIPLTKVKFDMNFHKNKKLAAWAVSNCHGSWTPSKRRHLVDELLKFIKIDIYGKCGNLKCPENLVTDVCESAASCHKYIGSKYKFYLAFENSMSPEYITEKFFNPLYHGTIPVVLGGTKEDYLRVAPNGSFIHVEDFKTIKELADYLLHLDSHPKEYMKYFEWTKQFKKDERNAMQRAFCKLCKKLHQSSNTDLKSYAVSGNDWWFYAKDSNREKPFRSFKRNSDGRILFSEDISIARRFVKKPVIHVS